MMRTVGVALRAEVSGYIASMKTVVSATKDVGRALEEAAKADKLNDLTRNAAVAGGGMLAFAGLAVKAAADFDASMSQVSAATHASTQDLQALRGAALQAGKDTAFSAGEAARGITELAKAGVGVQDILHGGLTGALSLAAAGEMDVGEAAETAATAMTQFKLSGAAVPHVADLLAAGAGKAQGEVHDLGYALKMSGLVAAQFGLSIEETTGTLAAFAKAGLIGSDAGTSLKTMLLRLAAPAGEAGQLMKNLEIAAYDSSGKFVGLANLAGQLQRGLSGLTQEQRDAAMATIFGSDAIRAANVLYSQGAKGIQNWTDQVDDAGFAADTAARKTDNLKGDLERLHGTLDTIMIQSGSGSAGVLRPIVQTVDALATSLASTPPIISSAIAGIIGLTGVVLIGSAGFLRYKQVVAESLTQLRAVGPAGERAAAGLQVAAKWAGRATIAFAALQILNTIGGLFAQTAPDVDRMANSLNKLAEAGQLTADSMAKSGIDLERYGKDLKMIKNLGGLSGAEKGAMIEPGFMRALDSSVQSTVERWKSYDDVLAQLIRSGNTKAAGQLFEELSIAARKQGVSINDLKAMLPSYTAALGEADKAGSAYAEAQKQVVKQNDLLHASWSALVDKAGDLKGAFDQINGAHLSYFDLQRKNVEATLDLKEALKDSGGIVDTSTEKSRAAGKALSEWITTQRDFIQGTYDEAVANGQTVTAADQARRAYEASRSALVNMLDPLGKNRTAAEELADGLFRMPAVTTVAVQAPEIRGIVEQLADLQQRLRVIDRAYHIQVYVNELRTQKIAYDTSQRERWGGVTTHAATGALREARTFHGGPTRYAFAEPETGGEAFIPRRGNYGRSMQILQTAAGWYGASIGGGTVINVGGITINGAGSPRATGAEVVDAIRRYEQSNGASWRR